MIGTPQVIAIVIVVLILFGAKRIPDLMGSLGKGIKEFKKATTDEGDQKKQLSEKTEDQEPKQS